jgi:antitoxin component of MazEF toxin-antitoxin module
MTVPSEVVEILKLEDGDKLRWVVFKNGEIHITKVKK